MQLTLNDREFALRSPDDSEKSLVSVTFVAPPPVSQPSSATTNDTATGVTTPSLPINPPEETVLIPSEPQEIPEITRLPVDTPSNTEPAPANPFASPSQIDIVPAKDPILLDNLKSSVIESKNSIFSSLAIGITLLFV